MLSHIHINKPNAIILLDFQQDIELSKKLYQEKLHECLMKFRNHFQNISSQIRNPHIVQYVEEKEWFENCMNILTQQQVKIQNQLNQLNLLIENYRNDSERKNMEELKTMGIKYLKTFSVMPSLFQSWNYKPEFNLTQKKQTLSLVLILKYRYCYTLAKQIEKLYLEIMQQYQTQIQQKLNNFKPKKQDTITKLFISTVNYDISQIYSKYSTMAENKKMLLKRCDQILKHYIHLLFEENYISQIKNKRWPVVNIHLSAAGMRKIVDRLDEFNFQSPGKLILITGGQGKNVDEGKLVKLTYEYVQQKQNLSFIGYQFREDNGRQIPVGVIIECG